MTINDIIIGHRVLIQSGAETKEHATVIGLTADGGVIVKKSDGNITEIRPQYILKSFGA